MCVHTGEQGSNDISLPNPKLSGTEPIYLLELFVQAESSSHTNDKLIIDVMLKLFINKSILQKYKWLLHIITAYGGSSLLSLKVYLALTLT